MRTDPIEKIVEEALNQADIRHLQDRMTDFYLPELGIYVECKQFFAPRIAEQMARVENVIVIQGRKAATAFAAMLRKM